MYNGEKVTDGQQGTMYIVGGCSSGSKFYDADSNGRPWQDVVYDENNPVFSVLKQRDGKLYFEAYEMCIRDRNNGDLTNKVRLHIKSIIDLNSIVRQWVC